MQRGSAWFSRIFSWWLVALVALLANWYTLLNGWSLDDASRLGSHPARQTAEAISGGRTPAGAIGAERVYRPLTSFSFDVTKSLSGGSAFMYHAVDLLLAVVCAALVFQVLLRLVRRRMAAFLGALFFAVLPLHTEAISSPSWGQPELLSTLLLLAGWIIHLEFTPRRGRLCWLAAGSGVLFFLALLASETKWPFPLSVALADFLLLARARGILFRRLLRRGAAIAYSSCAVAFALYAGMRISALGEWNPLSHNFLLNPLEFEAYPVRFLTGVYLVWKSFLLGFVPSTLSHDYSWYSLPVFSTPSPGAIIATLVLAGWIGAIVFSWARHRWLCFGLSFYLLNAAAVSNLFGLMPRMFAEHTYYWPAFGSALLFGMAVKSAAFQAQRLVPGIPLRRTVEGCAVLFLLCLSLVAIMRYGDWRDTSVLVRADYPKFPSSAVLNLRMANLYLEAGQYAMAEQLLLAGYSVHPGSHEIAANLSAGYLRTKNPERATELARWAVRLSPRNPAYRAQLGFALARAGKTDDALAELGKSAEEFPSFAYTYLLRGALWQGRHDLWAAERDLARAVELDPELEMARERLTDVRRQIRSLEMPGWLKNSNPVQ